MYLELANRDISAMSIETDFQKTSYMDFKLE